MLTKSFLLALTAAVLCSILPAGSQTPPNLPDGPGKEAVVTYCSGYIVRKMDVTPDGNPVLATSTVNGVALVEVK